MELGEPSPLTCPECHGVLLRLKEGDRTRYRCHTGHAYTADALLSGLTESTEDKAYQLIRVLEEVEMLLKELGAHYQGTGKEAEAQIFLHQVRDIEVRTQIVREIALSNDRWSEQGLRHKR